MEQSAMEAQLSCFLALEIVFDYMQSAANLKDSLNKYVLARPEVDIEIITPQEDYINGLLDYLGL